MSTLFTSGLKGSKCQKYSLVVKRLKMSTLHKGSKMSIFYKNGQKISTLYTSVNMVKMSTLYTSSLKVKYFHIVHKSLKG